MLAWKLPSLRPPAIASRTDDDEAAKLVDGEDALNSITVNDEGKLDVPSAAEEMAAAVTRPTSSSLDALAFDDSFFHRPENMIHVRGDVDASDE